MLWNLIYILGPEYSGRKRIKRNICLGLSVCMTHTHTHTHRHRHNALGVMGVCRHIYLHFLMHTQNIQTTSSILLARREFYEKEKLKLKQFNFVIFSVMYEFINLSDCL